MHRYSDNNAKEVMTENNHVSRVMKVEESIYGGPNYVDFARINSVKLLWLVCGHKMLWPAAIAVVTHSIFRCSACSQLR